MTDFSFQLYSARNFPPLVDTLALLSRLGYAQVEGFGGVYDDVAALRAALDDNGLAMPSGHFALDQLEDDFPAALAIAQTLGMTTMVCPFVAPQARPGDAAGWAALARRLSAVAARCKEAGMAFAWHNHDFEFASTSDGAIPMRVLLEQAPDIGWEIDVAWVARGGHDPLAWIAEFGSRIVAVHVKDIAPEGENASEDGWADVGHGTVDWKAIMSALRDTTPARIFAMEHDNPADIERFAARSIAAAKTF